MDRTERIRPLIRDKLRSMGLELWDLEYHRAGRRSVLKVYVDKPSGVTISECAQASRDLSVMLDVEEFARGPYSLEVSSPGVDRPLVEERDYRRVVGRRVTLTLRESETDRSPVSGVLQSCENGVVSLCTDDQGDIDVPMARVKVGKVEVTFR
jgi:ribosome maturation factor RimP